jgi:hypothetical protein
MIESILAQYSDIVPILDQVLEGQDAHLEFSSPESRTSWRNRFNKFRERMRKAYASAELGPMSYEPITTRSEDRGEIPVLVLTMPTLPTSVKFIPREHADND